MSSIVSYKGIDAVRFTFSHVKKENMVYFVKPNDKIFIQTPCITLKECMMNGEDALKNTVKFSVPGRFQQWLRKLDDHVVKYAVDNKTSLFHKELPDSFIEHSYKHSSELGDLTWTAYVHPEVSIFNSDKELCSPLGMSADTKVTCIIMLHSVRFTRHRFYCKWVVRSMRTHKLPEYNFIDHEDDYDDYTQTEEVEGEEHHLEQQAETGSVSTTKSPIHMAELSDTSVDMKELEDEVNVDITVPYFIPEDDNMQTEVQPEEPKVSDEPMIATEVPELSTESSEDKADTEDKDEYKDAENKKSPSPLLDIEATVTVDVNPSSPKQSNDDIKEVTEQDTSPPSVVIEVKESP